MIMYSFAKCCNPMQGDDVLAYITRGRGYIIHRKDCSNLKHMAEVNERTVSVKWTGDDHNMTDRLDTTRRAFSIGIDAGSTTIKFVVLDKTDGSVAYSSYRRHFADIRKCLEDTLEDMEKKIGADAVFSVCVTGSAGNRRFCAFVKSFGRNSYNAVYNDHH